MDRRRPQRGRVLRNGMPRPSRPRASGGRRQGRDRLERPRDRRARARRCPPGRAGVDRGGALGGGRRARRERRDRTAGSCARRSTRSRRARRRRSPTTASSRPVSSALAVATGEVAYADRARELVAACVRRRRVASRFRAAVTRCSPRRGSRRRMPHPTATSRRGSPRSPTPRCRCGCSARATSCAPRRADRRRARGRRARAAARVRRAAAGRGASSPSPPRQLVVVADDRSGPLVAAARGMPCRRPRDRDARAGGGVGARGLRAVRRQDVRDGGARPRTTAATSPAACRSPTRRS